MDILFTIQNNFAQHLAVAIVSILKNNSESSFRFHIVSANLSIKNKKRLRELVNRTSSSILYHDPPDLQKYNLKIDGHATEANYYRLFVADILPSSIDKIIYLDADLVVLKKLSSLWKTDITKYAIAAVNHVNKERSKQIGITESEYFNSGVMLINLVFWRKHDLIPKFTSFIHKHQELIKYWDQDVLNYTLKKKVKYLEYKYNYLKNNLIHQDVCILHYTGKLKPWNIHYPHPNRYEYFRYLRFIPWWFAGIKYILIEEKSLNRTIKYLCYKI